MYILTLVRPRAAVAYHCPMNSLESTLQNIYSNGLLVRWTDVLDRTSLGDQFRALLYKIRTRSDILSQNLAL